MSRTRSIIAICLMAAALAGCRRVEVAQVHFNRFDQLLFCTPASQLGERLRAEQSVYDTPLLNVAPNDPTYMQMLAAFVGDPTMQGVYRSTDSLFHDLTGAERQLGKALARVPELECRRFYAMIAGDFDNYDNRVFCHDGDLVVCLDRYALPYGLPSYLQKLCKPQYVVPDCVAALSRERVRMPEGDPTLLDCMVAEGRTLYTVKRALPDIADTILLRYTDEQLQWMKRNIKDVWTFILRDKLLYSTDLSRFHNLIDDAPKTNAFGEGSAPRTHAYIGLKIVEKYMKESGATLEQLLDETDSQAILRQSGWRP